MPEALRCHVLVDIAQYDIYSALITQYLCTAIPKIIDEFSFNSVQVKSILTPNLGKTDGGLSTRQIDPF